MKILVDVPDNRASSLIDVLRNMKNVRVKELTDEKAQLMEEIRDAVIEMKMIKSGKMEARDAREFLKEL